MFHAPPNRRCWRGLPSWRGFDENGGGKGYRPVDRSFALEEGGGELTVALRASWMPKVTHGWFFRAETFFSIARYLDRAAQESPLGGGPPPDFLSYSHGEGFIRFFEERCQRQGFFIFDEPESALSPKRQMEFLKLLHRMDKSERCQVIMATHSPVLMAYPNATLLEFNKYGLEPTTVEQTYHSARCRSFSTIRRGLWKRRSRSEEAIALAPSLRAKRSNPALQSSAGLLRRFVPRNDESRMA